MFVCGDVGLLIGDHVHRDSCVTVNHVTVLNVPVTDNGTDHALGLIAKLNAEHCGISRLHVLLQPSQLFTLPSSHNSLVHCSTKVFQQVHKSISTVPLRTCQLYQESAHCERLQVIVVDQAIVAYETSAHDGIAAVDNT